MDLSHVLLPPLGKFSLIKLQGQLDALGEGLEGTVSEFDSQEPPVLNNSAMPTDCPARVEELAEHVGLSLKKLGVLDPDKWLPVNVGS